MIYDLEIGLLCSGANTREVLVFYILGEINAQ